MVAWGEPCACHAKANPPRGARRNPPSDPNLAGIASVYEMLGSAVAIGALADQLGMPEGAALVERAARFVETSPTLNRAESALETGGFFGSAVSATERVAGRLTGTAAKAWGKVEQSAAAIWSRAKESPRLAAALFATAGGVILGSQYLSAEERTAAVQIANEKALLAETLSRVSPAEALAAVQKMNLLAPRSEGLSWVAWGAIGIGALVFWNILRSLLPVSR